MHAIRTCLGALLLLAGTAHGADRIWTNATNNTLWSNPGNWQGGVRPANGDRLVFPSITTTVSNNDIAGLSVSGLDISTSLNLLGEPMTITGSDAVTLHGVGRAVSVHNNLLLTSPSPTIATEGSLLEIDGRVTVAGDTLRVPPASRVIFQGGIVEQGALALDFAGEVTVDGASTVSGTIDFTGVVLRFSNLSALAGTAKLTVGPGRSRVTIAGSGPIQRPVDLRTSFAPSDLAGVESPGLDLGDATFLGTVALDGAQRIGGHARFEGPVIGTGRIVMNFPFSRVVLVNPANTFEGGFQVTAGEIQLGASNVIPDSGDIDFGDSTGGSSTGKLTLDDKTEAIRRITCGYNSSVSITPGRGQLRVLAPSSIGCRLDFTMPAGYVLPAGEITLVRNDSGSDIGKFINLPQDAQVNLDGTRRFITYRGGASGRDIVLVGPAPQATLEFEGPIYSRAIPALGVVVPSGTLPAVRATSAPNVPVANLPLTVTSTCGAGSVTTITTDANGRAQMPAFNPGTVAGTCYLAVSTGPAGYNISMQILLYDPATLSLTLSPTTVQTFTGVTFPLVATASAPPHAKLPGIPVAWSIEPGTASGVVVSAEAATSSTDNFGEARATIRGGTGAGTYRVAVRQGSASAFTTVTQTASLVSRSIDVASASGSGTIKFEVFEGGPNCTFASATLEARSSPRLPPGWEFLHGIARIRLQGCVPGSTPTVRVTYPQTLAHLEYWRLGVLDGDTAARWSKGTATVTTTTMSFAITDGGTSDDDRAANGSISHVFGVGSWWTPQVDHTSVYWGGPQENGWGMTIVQERDAIFIALYVYDAAGNPTWYVMSDGNWSDDGTNFRGALYHPRASPYYQYDVSRFVVGNPVGTATVTMPGSGTGALAYTIDGISGTKAIQRLAVGASPANFGRMFWGGTEQNGWGIASLNGGGPFFTVWYTYDANGMPTWFVMPDGRYDFVFSTVSGRLYRPTGSPWVGQPYDVSRFVVTDIGSYTMSSDPRGGFLQYKAEGREGQILFRFLMGL